MCQHTIFQLKSNTQKIAIYMIFRVKSHESLGLAFTSFHVIHTSSHVISHVKSYDF